jgi:hypothetical protein
MTQTQTLWETVLEQRLDPTVVFFFVIAVQGCFHEAPTAGKEVGAGLLVTHISLAIALIVPLIRGNLSMVDAVLGSMILDGQNTALSIQLSTKETLAARWQV